MSLFHLGECWDAGIGHGRTLFGEENAFEEAGLAGGRKKLLVPGVGGRRGFKQSRHTRPPSVLGRG